MSLFSYEFIFAHWYPNQLPRLSIEKYDHPQANACRPISHALQIKTCLKKLSIHDTLSKQHSLTIKERYGQKVLIFSTAYANRASLRRLCQNSTHRLQNSSEFFVYSRRFCKIYHVAPQGK